MFRRRHELETDYRKRLKMLKSRTSRLVVRRSLNGVRCQIIEYDKAGDRTVVEVFSKSLARYGWKSHFSNIPAAYLTGLVAGFSTLKKGIKEAIVDIGMQRSTKGNALYACVAGVASAGVKIPVNEEIFPSKDRLTGKHISQFAAALKKTPEKYKRQFSQYLRSSLEPEKLEEHFTATQNKIREEFKDVAKLTAFEETAEKFLKG